MPLNIQHRHLRNSLSLATTGLSWHHVNIDDVFLGAFHNRNWFMSTLNYRITLSVVDIKKDIEPFML